MGRELLAAAESLGLLELGTVTNACDPSTRVADVGGVRVQGQSALK